MAKKKKEISNVHRIFPRTRLFIELCIPWEGGKEWLEISIKFLRLLEQIHRGEHIENTFPIDSISKTRRFSIRANF